MKTVLIILSIILLLIGCTKDFKTDNKNLLEITSANDLPYAIAAVNYNFASIHKGLTMLIGNSDDMVYTTGWESNPVLNFQWTKPSLTDNFLMSAYQPLYKTIACANEIIEKSNALNLNDGKSRKLLGEVYFMRAYAYFWLVRTFGRVPLVTKTQVDYTLLKPSFEDIYNLITADLKTAIEFLPANAYESRVQYTTPHKGSAQTLLAEVYLSMGGYPLKNPNMYTKAAEVAGEVIDNASNLGFGLMTDMAQLWDGAHDENEESVFAIYSGSNSNSNNSNVNELFINFSGHPMEYIDPQTAVKSDVYAGLLFFNTYPQSYRKQVSFHSLRYTVSNEDTLWKVINKINVNSPIQFRKYYTTENPMLYDYLYQNKFSTFNNLKVIYLLRYAHTLLTYAEAKARNGVLDDKAYEAVNQVRRRANKVDIFTPSPFDLPRGLTASQFADSVVAERAWEFCGEPEGRWFDLLRLEMVANLQKLKAGSPGELFPFPINQKTYFYPIPKTDQLLNPNFKDGK